jgi:hypothetical protein
MKLRNLSDRVVIDAIEAFYNQANGFVGVVARVVAGNTWSLPRHPRRKGISEFPYFFAVDLYELFDYARGRRQMSPSFVEKQCDIIDELLHTTLAGQRVEPDWSTFADTPLGLCILAAGARINLRADEGIMDAREVMLLADWNSKYLMHSGLQPLKTDTDPSDTGESDAIRFASADVRAAFEEAGVAV